MGPQPPPHDHDATLAEGVEILDFSDPMNKARMAVLMVACEQTDGHLPFGDHELLAITAGQTHDHIGFGLRDGAELSGYGHLSSLGASWFCEVAVHPQRRCKGIATRIMDSIVEHVAAHGGGTLSTWAYHMDGPTSGLAEHAGFRPVRTLHQLRLDPLPDAAPSLPTGFLLDYFRTGRDETAWLALNARAFADLPDQGAWTQRDLSVRIGARWFDEKDVLLLRRDGDIVGTCWCKIDPEARSGGRQLGEIYVMALDPAHAGGGLGKTLALTGLVHLRSRGAQIGMLYVDGANERAMQMYASLGFRPHHEDVCLMTDVPAG